ncbi:MAG: hypothetical protein WEF86_01055 [Gemmatimonadota bacterium]
MIRKTMLVAAVAVLAVPAMASAQATGTITATATVADYIDLSGTDDLAFGTLDRAADNTVSAIDGSATRDVAFNRNVEVTFSNVPSQLVGTVSGNNLAVTLTCAYEIGGSWSTPETCGTNPFDLDVGASVTTATLGFGGTVTGAAAANAVADEYRATMDIRVDAR